MLATPQHLVASAIEGMLALETPANTWFKAPVMAIMVRRASQAGYEDSLRNMFPNVRVYQAWEGAGYFLMMEQQERFNTALAEFLDRK